MSQPTAKSPYTLRPVIPDDEPILKRMVFIAAHMEDRPPQTPLADLDPGLPRYVEHWGRVGDLGFIALDGAGRPAGAVWCRVFPPDDPGYGTVAPGVPELAIGIEAQHRGRGLGGLLLGRLLDEVRSGYRAISLSARADNAPALALYRRMGFALLSDSGVPNRVGGVSIKMRLDF